MTTHTNQEQFWNDFQTVMRGRNLVDSEAAFCLGVMTAVVALMGKCPSLGAMDFAMRETPSVALGRVVRHYEEQKRGIN